MRVLLTVQASPPRSTAGVEVYTWRLARALKALGHEVLVLSAVHDYAAAPYALSRRRHEDVAVVEVASVHPQGTLEASYDDPELTRAARRVIGQFRPDCVHAQHLLNLSAGLLDEARAAGAAVVVTLHDHWASCPRDGLRMRADLALCESVDHAVCAACLRDSPYLVPALQTRLAEAARWMGLARGVHGLQRVAPRAVAGGVRLLRGMSPVRQDLAAAMDRRAARLRAALGGADLLLAPSAFVRERALEFGLPARRLRHLTLGAAAHAPRPRPAGARRRFGFVGTLAPHKGVHVLIQAFRGLRMRDATLELWGGATAHPAYAGSLRRAAQGDPRIRFRGSFPEGGQPDVLAGLDAVVLPSIWWENAPLVLVEALAAGRPVVASAIGGVPELVADGETGLLVPARDAEALRGALERLAEGRALAGALPPLPLKTVEQGAREMQELYAALAAARLEVAT
jgi:glycosyltransferase involved in cell wall biosynthesis